jgi:tannase/feruloyl esterase
MLNQADKSSYISPTELEKIGAATQAACDASDGVKDGLISDPLRCSVIPAALLLSAAQSKTFEAIHSGPKTSAGKNIYSGLPFGAEHLSWRNSITGPSFEEASALKEPWVTFSIPTSFYRLISGSKKVSLRAGLSRPGM